MSKSFWSIMCIFNGLRFPSSNKFEIFTQRMFQSSFKRIWKIFFDLSHRQAWSYGWTERRTQATTLPLRPYGRGVNIVEVHVWKCTPWFTLCTRVRLFSYYVRVLMCTIILRRVWLSENLSPLHGVGGAVRFLVVGTISQEDTGSALDGAVFDIAQILAYLVHNMSRSHLYLGFGHFGWLPSFSVNNILAGLWLNCISSVEITLFLLADILLQHRALFQC